MSLSRPRLRNVLKKKNSSDSVSFQDSLLHMVGQTTFFICFDIVLCHFSVISSYSKGRSLEGSRSLSAIFLSFHTSIGPCSFLENVVLNPSMLLLLLYVSSSRVSRCWLGRCPVVQNTAAAAGARLGVEATVGAFVCLFVNKHCDLEFLFWRVILQQQASHGCEGG